MNLIRSSRGPAPHSRDRGSALRRHDPRHRNPRRRILATALALALAGSFLPTALPASFSTSPPAVAASSDWVRDQQYWLDGYGIRDAWGRTRGEGIRIAIIDSGIGFHPTLEGAVVDGADFSGSGSTDGRTPVSDHPEHGTIVATLAAGRGTGADTGVIGSAPAAELLAASISFAGDREIADAVVWAVDHGADVINLSLTRNSLDWPATWDEAFLYAEQHDVVVVAAAGNRGSGTEHVGAPATIPGVLVVGGLTRGGTASQSSSSQGITLGIAAPSEQLVVGVPGGGYRTTSGTSGAAPIVAGVVALVRAAHPELDSANVVHRILATAVDAGPAGVDISYGYGILDADAAVSADVALVDEHPLGTIEEWIRLHRRDAGEATPIPIPSSSLAPPDYELVPPAAAERADGVVAFQLDVVPWLVTALLTAMLLIGGIVILARCRTPRARR